MENKITKQKIEKYKELTKKALEKAKRAIINGKEREAKEIINMVSNYLSDAEHFEKNQNLVNAFAALNYAHGWLDAGARLDIFDVKDDKLFTIKWNKAKMGFVKSSYYHIYSSIPKIAYKIRKVRRDKKGKFYF